MIVGSLVVLVVWLFGCLGVWAFGCLVVWAFGRLVVWAFGCLAKIGCELPESDE